MTEVEVWVTGKRIYPIHFAGAMYSVINAQPLSTDYFYMFCDDFAFFAQNRSKSPLDGVQWLKTLKNRSWSPDLVGEKQVWHYFIISFMNNIYICIYYVSKNNKKKEQTRVRLLVHASRVLNIYYVSKKSRNACTIARTRVSEANK